MDLVRVLVKNQDEVERPDVGFSDTKRARKGGVDAGVFGDTEEGGGNCAHFSGLRFDAVGAEETIQGSVIDGKAVTDIKMGTATVIVRPNSCGVLCGRGDLMETTTRRWDSSPCLDPFSGLRDGVIMEVIFGSAEAAVRRRRRSVCGDG